MHLLFKKSTLSFVITKKRIYYAVGFVVFMTLFFAIRSKYFERSDFLRPVSRTIKNAAGQLSKPWTKQKSNIVEDILDSAVSDGNQLVKMGDSIIQPTLPPWEKWMLENPHLQSVGDIYDKCGR